MKKAIVWIGLCLLWAACTPGPKSETPESDPQQARDSALAQIEAANEAITRLTREGEFEAAGKFFAPDVVQMISGQPPIQGRKAWVAAQAAAAEIGDWSLELEVLDFRYFGDQAVERGRGVQTFVANENSPIPSMEMTGDYLVLWERTADGWQIRYDYVVVEPPAGE
ncbi:DUF4440 domain-containing protein [Robiginitalea sp. M366]|uniref:YybH family protein n=1 Tax=Robiginitalea aestuariiviva TaxID=3036903 RepID=UPI00240D54B1|nr:DUF4440 domain-containing protein [Robiginitalea aestuariiviva]MDG1572359.1 DUF4440 domain-containing protein [Robiginitalea aestuariiviva]